jgi:hypothetical protein
VNRLASGVVERIMATSPRFVGPVVLVAAVVVGLATGDHPPRARALFSIDLSVPHDRTAAEATIRRVAHVVQTDLGVPLPQHFTVYVYDSPRHFAEGLMLDADVAPATAVRLAEFAVGVTVPDSFLLRMKGSAWGKAETLRVVAHELAHLGQIELAQGEGRGAQWLAEGMAEWTAYSTLERFGLGTLAGYRVTALSDARAHFAAYPTLDLDGLSSPADFLSRHRREGTLPTYRVAFVLADYLIARDGLPRMLDYFRAFAHEIDPARNFNEAFGQDLAAFETEVRRYLAKTI